MRLIQNINQRPVARITMILLAAVMLSAAVTDALAAGRGGVGEGSHGGGGGIKGSHIGGAFRGPLLDRAPSMPPPVFNPSSPYTVPQSPETPVSPASPGSVFGNG
jgi:hypothetical protein